MVYTITKGFTPKEFNLSDKIIKDPENLKELSTFIKEGSSPRGWPLENLEKLNMN